MVKHVVFWKLKDQAEGNDKTQNALLIKEKLYSLPALIPEILSLEVGINLENGNYDVGLYSAFADEEALNAYQIHPEHQKVKDFIQKVRSESAAFDYKI